MTTPEKAAQTERELLELAARAAGMKDMRWSTSTHDLFDPLDQPWNPLHDHGDALLLAVKLEMDVFVRGGRWSEAVAPMGPACKEMHSDHADPYAATCLAIVRAAAAIGAQSERTGSAQGAGR
jgi:hypothetical protein